MAASIADPLIHPQLRRGLVLRVAGEESCQVLLAGQAAEVPFASRFPSPRERRVSPGNLVAVAEVAGHARAIVWRWFDAVVLGTEADGIRLWEPLHGEVVAQPRNPRQRYDRATRAYLSAGLPGADWWVAGQAVNRAEDADVELGEVERLYSEHALWPSVFGPALPR
ncbi:MAG: hypothetical protein ABSA02_07040 [Trebonia sp.]|jgi:hypothetical protein